MRKIMKNNNDRRRKYGSEVKLVNSINEENNKYKW